MQSNQKYKILSILFTLAFVFCLFTTMPLVAYGEDGLFQVTENPVGATYMLNETAVPIKATFEYKPLTGQNTINSSTPILVQWYWSASNISTGRSNGFGESAIDYDRQIEYTTTLTPETDKVGVRYYYAVVTYGVNSGNAESIPKETVTATARIEVIDHNIPEPEGLEPNNPTSSFTVRKVDEDGNPLSGAVLALVPNENYPQDSSVISYEKTTVNGNAEFAVTPGQYVLHEKQAPAGYNATDDKHYITVTSDGVFLNINSLLTHYETVTFVNKRIPALDKENHIAFIQGYPEGTFMQGRNMTRAEAVVMFSRLLSKSMNMTIDHRNNYYPDVAPTAWYANQVGYMQSLGVLADYSRDARFRPDDPVTRAEFATLAAHFDNLILTETNSFSDVTAGHWAVKYINSAAAKGWITGYPDGTFRPEANITRAEVVTLVGRMLDRTADSVYLATNTSSLPKSYSDLATDFWAYHAIMEASIGHDYVRVSGGEQWTSVH